MSDQVTVVSHRGWGNRIVGSLSAIIFGVIFFLGSFAVLFWNDSRVDISTLAQEAAVLDAASVTTDSALQGGMVSVTGTMTVGSALGDGDYLKPGDYVAVERHVEMYSWIEDEDTRTEEEVGGGETTTTTYTYSKGWTESPMDSAQFKESFGHENPKLTIEGKTVVSDAVAVGAYRVSTPGIRLRGWENLGLTGAMIGLNDASNRDVAAPAVEFVSADVDGDGITAQEEEAIGTDPDERDTDKDGLNDGLEVRVYGTDPLRVDTDGDTYADGAEVGGGYDPAGTGAISGERQAEIATAEESLSADITKYMQEAEQAQVAVMVPEPQAGGPGLRFEGGYGFIGSGSVASPEVGDVRISYRVIGAGRVGTVFGRLSGDTINPHVDESGNRVHSLSVGTRDDALAGMHAEYVMSLWFFRILGFFMMWFGLMLVINPLTVILDFLPIFGRASRFIFGLLATLISVVLSGLTVAIARLFHSPLAVALMVAAVFVSAIIIIRKRMAKKESAAA